MKESGHGYRTREVRQLRESSRPRRVVVVNADNPLEEISGEFFWREDHERLVADARRDAFERGYAEGFRHAAAAASRRPVVRVRGRRRAARGAVVVLVLLVVAAYFISLFTS